MGNDVERVVISNEWAEIQSGNVLDAVFFLDTFSKILVSTHTVAQGLDTSKELGMGTFELLATAYLIGVEHGTISQDDAC